MANHLIVYDVNLDRPACPVLQASLGGDLHIADLFPADLWITKISASLKLFTVNDKQLAILLRRHAPKAKAAHV